MNKFEVTVSRTHDIKVAIEAKSFIITDHSAIVFYGNSRSKNAVAAFADRQWESVKKVND